MNLIHGTILKIARGVNQNRTGRISIYRGWIFSLKGYEYQVNPIIRMEISEVMLIASIYLPDFASFYSTIHTLIITLDSIRKKPKRGLIQIL